MAILPVLTFPDPRLKIVSKPVDAVDDDIRKLMDDMYETMIAEDGAGLAAPQVGVHKRVVVMDFSYRDPKSKPMYMANLEVMEILDTEKCDLSEGCLSVPEMYAPVGRPRKIRYRYLNRDNVLIEDIAEDIVSICVQHEIDHLDGKLFIDRLSPLKRQFILNKMNKRK